MANILEKEDRNTDGIKHVEITVTVEPQTCEKCGSNILREQEPQRPTRYVCPKCQVYLTSEFRLVHELTPAEVKLQAFVIESGNMIIKTGIKFDGSDMEPDIEAFLDKKGFECNVCSETFDTEEEFAAHVEEEHIDEEEEGNSEAGEGTEINEGECDKEE